MTEVFWHDASDRDAEDGAEARAHSQPHRLSKGHPGLALDFCQVLPRLGIFGGLGSRRPAARGYCRVVIGYIGSQP